MSKPNNLVVDVSSSHQPGMVYVMLSRVQSLDQLTIVNALDPTKITVNEKVLTEAARMWKISVNMNPCQWMDPATEGLKVCSLNTLSLRKHIEDVRRDPVLLKSDLLCLAETWLEADEERDGCYQLEGYQAHFTSQGRGKGLAVYVKQGQAILGVNTISEPKVQLIKVVMRQLDVVAVYRSQEEPFYRAAHFLKTLINPEKDTLVIGDVNYCARKEENDFSKYLLRARFQQLVTMPTHIKGGMIREDRNCFQNCHNCTLSGILDQAHHRGSSTEVAATTFSHYFSDHDSVACIVTLSG